MKRNHYRLTLNCFMQQLIGADAFAHGDTCISLWGSTLTTSATSRFKKNWRQPLSCFARTFPNCFLFNIVFETTCAIVKETEKKPRYLQDRFSLSRYPREMKRTLVLRGEAEWTDC
ncbi:hypothetical protein PUN28_005868 [Cardiocondyla obscurior]|uniref:Uncharacterized protein n=1 Tax=Cardiocondyla obscurior TaxID=286306 RepID=A0AAW2G634_9HYME